MKFGIGIYFDGEKVLKMVSTLYWHQGGPKQGLGCIYSLNYETRQNFYKTKVVEDLPNRKVGQVLTPTPSQYTLLF